MPRLIGGEIGRATFSFGRIRAERANDAGDLHITITVDGERIASFSMLAGEGKDFAAQVLVEAGRS